MPAPLFTRQPSLRALAWVACACLALQATQPHAATPLAIDQPAPDFTLRAASGSNLRLKEQRGQVVLVNFWASWCAPCRQELPQLERLYQRYRGAGFVLLGVNIDDDPKTGAALAQQLGLQFPVLFDADKAVSKRYALASMPSSVFIDRDGRVRKVQLGFKEGAEQQVEQTLRSLLME